MAPSTLIAAWEQDPGSGSQPDGGQLLQVPVPPALSSLKFTIVHQGQDPPPAIYNTGTPEFRYWTAVEALTRCSLLWSDRVPGIQWHPGEVLTVNLDVGNLLNANYDRRGLNFFHANIGGRTVFSGESPDVVCHEQGHAVLDAIKPQLWDSASAETGAFHESFADCSAILCALQLKSLREGVLEETDNQVYHSSRLSRLAEQLGWAIRQREPSRADPDCMRNAVNSFFYQDPNTLPSDGPNNILSSELHSFSRVFTGAFFEGLAGMFIARNIPGEQTLLTVSLDMAQILVLAISASPVVPSFYSQVAAHMLSIANDQFSQFDYAQALRSAFVRHGIISPVTSISSLTPMTRSIASMAAVAPLNPTPSTTLPLLRLSVSQYGFGEETILVHAASEAKRFDTASASLSFGALLPTTHDIAARAFIEDLLRRGRLKTPEATGGTRSMMGILPPSTPDRPETFTHELRREGNDLVLKRIRVDCCFH